MRIGETNRFSNTGTACFKISCLSAIERELSILNDRSMRSIRSCTI